MAAFTYPFCDLVTNKYLGQVPLAGVSFSSQLNSAGSFSAKLKLSDPIVQKTLQGVAVADDLLPTGRTAIYVDMDGTLVWGGILWTTSYDSPSQTVTLGAVEFWSYFAQRVISWNTAFYYNEDQFSIVEDLINTCQARQPGGSIGVTVPTSTCGATFTINWDPSQLVSVAQAVQTMATQAGSLGFDYGIDVAYSAGLPTKSLTLSYPRRGRLAGTTSLTLDVGESRCLGYVWPIDSTQQDITVWGIGAGSGPGSSLRAAQMFQPLITDGYPMLEGTLQRSDIINQTTLKGVTRTYLAARAYPVALPVITVSLDSPVTDFSQMMMGDDIRVVIPPDPFFLNGCCRTG
jgi:hypothetical protein